MHDRFGRPLHLGSYVVMNVSGNLAAGMVGEMRPTKLSRQVGVKHIASCGTFLPNIHAEHRYDDPVELAIARYTYKVQTSWQDANKLISVQPDQIPTSDLPRATPGGPLLVDWSSIPLKYNLVVMNQDLTFEAYTHHNQQDMEHYGEMPDRLDLALIEDDEVYLDFNMWQPHGSWGHLDVFPWQILVRPPYYEWRNAICTRPATT